MRLDDINPAPQVPYGTRDPKVYMPLNKPIKEMTLSEVLPALICCDRSKGRPEVCRTCLSCAPGKQAAKLIRNGEQ